MVLKNPKMLLNTTTLLNTGLALFGVVGLSNMFDFALPAIVGQISSIMLGVAGLLFLFGRKRLA